MSEPFTPTEPLPGVLDALEAACRTGYCPTLDPPLALWLLAAARRDLDAQATVDALEGRLKKVMDAYGNETRDLGYLKRCCVQIHLAVARTLDAVKLFVPAEVYHTLAAVASDAECKRLAAEQEAEVARLTANLAGAERERDALRSQCDAALEDAARQRLEYDNAAFLLRKALEDKAILRDALESFDEPCAKCDRAAGCKWCDAAAALEATKGSPP